MKPRVSTDITQRKSKISAVAPFFFPAILLCSFHTGKIGSSTRDRAQGLISFHSIDFLRVNVHHTLGAVLRFQTKMESE